MPPVPFRVRHSQHARELLTRALRDAAAAGRRTEATAAALSIERGLTWFADELGESRLPLRLMGELRCVTILPVTAYFAVHVGRREVQVSRYRFIPHRTRS